MEAVVQGEVFVASSNVKLPLFVSTTTSYVLLGSSVARSAFDLSPPITQFMGPFALPVVVGVVLLLLDPPPQPTSRMATGSSRARRVMKRPPGLDGSGHGRSRLCTRYLATVLPPRGLRANRSAMVSAPHRPARALCLRRSGPRRRQRGGTPNAACPWP